MSLYFAQGLGILSSILEITILIRAMRGRFASRFPFFYSYLTYVFVGSAAIFYGVQHLWPQSYRTAFWIHFLISLLMEFAVLVEFSDHLFGPYPAIRSLGRWLTCAVSIVFFIFYIRPVLEVHEPTALLITELVKRSSITKAIIILCLLATVRYFGLAMNTNTSGMITGLGLYLASNILNFELLARLGGLRYGATFAKVGPISYTLCLFVWLVALWRYEPVVFISRGPFAPDLLDRFNNSLSRLLRK